VGAVVSVSDADIEKHVPAILEVFALAFAKYQARNLLSLYDAVSSFCGTVLDLRVAVSRHDVVGCGCTSETVGSALQEHRFIAVLLPPLVSRWNLVADDDELAMPPLMECFVFVITAIGTFISPFAPQIYKRCVVGSLCLLARHAAHQRRDVCCVQLH
jgi:transportin-1